MGRTGENPLYLKSADEIGKMRRAGRLLQRIVQETVRAVAEGSTTLELDKLAHARIREAKARPAFLNLYGFPNTCCISVNEGVVHGIPNRRKLQRGDLVKVDCGLVLEGFYADTAFTVGVGPISPEAERLMRVARESLYLGIDAARLPGRVGDIGAAVGGHCTAHGYSVAKDYTGHGVGRHLHEDPKVYNDGHERGVRLQPGMTLAIEPMVNTGTGDCEELSDGWTVVTRDRKLSAHFEHTIAITPDGPEILTISEEEEAVLGGALVAPGASSLLIAAMGRPRPDGAAASRG